MKGATVKGSKEAETGADARALHCLIDSLAAKMDANNTIIKKRPSMQVPKQNLVDTDDDESDGTMMVSRDIGQELKAQEAAAASCGGGGGAAAERTGKAGGEQVGDDESDDEDMPLAHKKLAYKLKAQEPEIAKPINAEKTEKNSACAMAPVSERAAAASATSTHSQPTRMTLLPIPTIPRKTKKYQLMLPRKESAAHAAARQTRSAPGRQHWPQPYYHGVRCL